MRAVFLFLFILVNVISAQSDRWADSVITYTFGTNTDFGQDSTNFPANILGAPDTSASDLAPSSIPEEICALGLAGEIVLKFTDNLIVDGDGPDFTIFENPFIIQAGPRAGEIFAEPAEVSVSQDGIIFYTFPFDSTTLVGCAGVTPTFGFADPTNPDSSGGDSFDLADLELDSIRYVKIRDVTAIIKSEPNHPYFDFTANGFDLDAVVAINEPDTSVTSVAIETETSLRLNAVVYPNPASKSKGGSARIFIPNNVEEIKSVRIFNILGEEIFSDFGPGIDDNLNLNLTNFSTGVYIYNISSNSQTFVSKFIVVK